MNGSIVNSNVL